MKQLGTTLGSRAVDIALWALLVSVDGTAQIALKVGSGRLAGLDFGVDWLLAALTSGGVLLAIAGYVGSFLAWMLILRRSDLSLAVPVSALIFVWILIGSWVYLDERITALNWIGIALILSGILLVAENEATPEKGAA